MDFNTPLKLFLYLVFAIFLSGLLYFLGGIDSLKVRHESLAEGRMMSEVEPIEEPTQKEESNAQFKNELKFVPLEKQTLIPKGEAQDQEVALTDENQKHGVSEEKTENIPLEDLNPAKEIKDDDSLGNSNNEYFKSLRDNYGLRVLDQLKEGDIRRDIIIRYYNHPADQNKIYSLEELGFYIHERPVQGSLISYESNAVFYGDNVIKEDLKLVVYYLLKEGMPIKHITKSQFHDGWKSSSIEIGTDTASTNKSIISLEQLRSMNF